MKFEKFLKSVGTRGTIVDGGEKFGKFLKLANVMLKIPDGVNIIAPLECKMTVWQSEPIVDFIEGFGVEAPLTGATLPTPDASPSSIRRIFGDVENGKIAIDNKTFGIIERSDHVYSFIHDDDFSVNVDEFAVYALVVTTGYGDDEEIAGVIFDELYYHNRLLEKE